MPELGIGEYQLVYNIISFTLAAMLGSLLFFVLRRNDVAPPYRISLIISAVVVTIAAYHYARIFISWGDAFALAEGVYVPTAQGFNDAYRYVDWLLTVPLLMAELVLVLRLPRGEGRSLLTKLVVAAALMIGLGWPGEASTAFGTQLVFWVLSMIPFLYIIYVLFTELTQAIQRQPEGAQKFVRLARNLTVVVWLFYPIAYLFPLVGLEGSTAEVGRQVGYSIADVTAKCAFGVIIYFIASAKSQADGWYEERSVKISS